MWILGLLLVWINYEILENILYGKSLASIILGLAILAGL